MAEAKHIAIDCCKNDRPGVLYRAVVLLQCGAVNNVIRYFDDLEELKEYERNGRLVKCDVYELGKEQWISTNEKISSER